MERTGILHLATVVVLAGGLFLVDLQVPLGVAVWLPYVGVALLSLWFPSRWQTSMTAAVCTVLLLLGLFSSPPGSGHFLTAAINRLLGCFAVWIAAIVGLAARRTRQLQEANKQLQQEIRERERLQAQLLRGQRLESIGVLAGGIAHDFNNLLTPILMAVKLLKENRPDEERQHLLTTLQASAERGAEMVRQLLAFAGGSDGQCVTVQTKFIIKEIKDILEHTFPKTIQISEDVADNLKSVHADPTQLSQVLMNLCVNARDAMPAGGLLTIQARNVFIREIDNRIYPDVRPGSYVLIAVADTGSGIRTDVLDKMYDPFFTTKEPGKGTGLGLSTALGIVKNHGGFILVQSAVGKGSRFAIHLPAVDETEARQDALVPPEQPDGQGKLILVVDDESLIVETARATLENHGYRVVSATDGYEAIELYKQHGRDIQVVLLDMMMPGMDGQATLAAIEELDPKVRIIASSGLPVSGRVAEVIAVGQGAYLPKPYSDEQLLATLARVLGKDEGQQGKRKTICSSLTTTR